MIVAGAAVVVVSEPTRDVAKQEPPWLMGLLVGEGLAPVGAAGADGEGLAPDDVAGPDRRWGPIAAGLDGEGLAPVGGAAGAGLVPLRWADAEGLAPVGAAVVVVSEPMRNVSLALDGLDPVAVGGLVPRAVRRRWADAAGPEPDVGEPLGST